MVLSAGSPGTQRTRWRQRRSRQRSATGCASQRGCHARRCLLLEDADTGDILMPLFYMRAIFEANYSRKLASLKHRRVPAPPGSSLAAAQPAGCSPYWQWAFESPQHVKAVVKQALGDKLMPQARPRAARAVLPPGSWLLKGRLQCGLMGRGLLQAPAALPAGPRPHSARLPEQAPPGGPPRGGMPRLGAVRRAGPPAAGARADRVQRDGAEGVPARTAAVPRAVPRAARVDVRPAAAPPAAACAAAGRGQVLPKP